MPSLLSLRLRSRANSCPVAPSSRVTLDWCILHITFNTFVWLQHTCSDRTCSNTMKITWLNPAELKTRKCVFSQYLSGFLSLCSFFVCFWSFHVTPTVSGLLFAPLPVLSAPTQDSGWIFPLNTAWTNKEFGWSSRSRAKMSSDVAAFPQSETQKERQDSRTDVPTPLKGKKQQRQSCWSF